MDCLSGNYMNFNGPVWMDNLIKPYLISATGVGESVIDVNSMKNHIYRSEDLYYLMQHIESKGHYPFLGSAL